MGDAPQEYNTVVHSAPLETELTNLTSTKPENWTLQSQCMC